MGYWALLIVVQIDLLYLARDCVSPDSGLAGAQCHCSEVEDVSRPSDSSQMCEDPSHRFI